MSTHEVKRVSIIGGGFIGIEMADNFLSLGLHVTIIEMAPQILAPLDPEMAAPRQEHLSGLGAELILGDGVKEILPYGQSARIMTAQGRAVDADLVILAIGVKPNSQIAKEAGLAVGERGGIVVDSHLRTSDPSIFAAGDVIQSMDYVNKVPAMVPLAGPANRQGRIAALGVADQPEIYEGSLGTFIVCVSGMAAGSTGTNEKTLARLGKQKGTDYDIVSMEAPSHAGYYPGMKRLKMKAIFSLPEKKLMGAQVVGKEGVDKRVDVLATAIRLGARMADLKELDLAYAPMFSTPKDAVNVLGYLAEEEISSNQQHYEGKNPKPGSSPRCFSAIAGIMSSPPARGCRSACPCSQSASRGRDSPSSFHQGSTPAGSLGGDSGPGRQRPAPPRPCIRPSVPRSIRPRRRARPGDRPSSPSAEQVSPDEALDRLFPLPRAFSRRRAARSAAGKTLDGRRFAADQARWMRAAAMEPVMPHFGKPVATYQSGSVSENLPI
jgi:hypothetical protein